MKVIDALDDEGRLDDEVGEIADDYPAATPEAKAELDAFLLAWVEKHANPNQYWLVVELCAQQPEPDDSAGASGETDRSRQWAQAPREERNRR